MKLALSSEKNVEILVAQGPIVAHDIQVLRAGIQKILRTGKNKIILELPGSDELPSEVLRELATFDIVARELAGRIVLAQVSPLLKSKIEVFAKPPVILSFETRPQALGFLNAPPPPEVMPEAAKPAESDTHLLEFSNLKAQVAELERKNKALEEQIVVTTLKRRMPGDEAVYLEKIKTLEAKIEALLTAAPAPAAAPAAAPASIAKP